MCYIMSKTTGEIIKTLRKQRGLRQEELAEMVSVTPNYIAMIETGRRQGKFIYQRIAEKLGVKVEVLYGEIPLPIFKPKLQPLSSMLRDFEERFSALEVLEVPIIGRIPAGVPRIEEGQNLGFVHPLKATLKNVPNPEKLYALVVEGESLKDDGIHSGDRLLIQPLSEVDIQNKIYICVLLDDGVVARHVEVTKTGKYRLKSANKHYEDIEPDKLIIQGRAIRKMPPEEDL